MVLGRAVLGGDLGGGGFFFFLMFCLMFGCFCLEGFGGISWLGLVCFFGSDAQKEFRFLFTLAFVLDSGCV